MADLTQQFISELIRAANQAGRLTKLERTRLLQRASITLLDMNGPEDAVYRLSEYGRICDGFTDAETSAALLDAVSEISAARRT